MKGDYEKAKATAKRFKDLFGEDYYIELQDHGLPEQKKTNPDLIKIAMNSLFGRLTELKMKSKIIMQVHDELIIETPKDELERVTALVKETMELNQPLCVPLEVNTAYGNNWVEH